MRRQANGFCLYIILFIIILIVVIVVGLLLDQSWGFSARVAEVVDGDTVRLENGQSVRLTGIDAPELGHGKGPDQVGGAEARKLLEELVKGRQVEIETLPVKDGRDHYGRVLAIVHLPQGSAAATAQEALLDHGLAFVYVHVDHDPAFVARLLGHQKKAMAGGQGFWPRVLAQPDPLGGYMGNARSKRFGARDCGVAQQPSRRNQVHFETMREAFAAGFSPYRECTPWPMAK